MRALTLICIISFILLIDVSAQDTATMGSVMVWSEQGWMMKARNSGHQNVSYKFSWTTLVTNSEGEVVSSIAEESQLLSLNAWEERHLFTAPQDPNRLMTYKFNNITILLVEIKPMSMQELIEHKKRAKIESGQ